MVEYRVEWCNVALNLKNPEVESLAAEVAALARESKTEAIRQALIERRDRLQSTSRPRRRSDRAAGILRSFRAALPPEMLGRPLTRAEEDELLGYGEGGV